MTTPRAFDITPLTVNASPGFMRGPRTPFSPERERTFVTPPEMNLERHAQLAGAMEERRGAALCKSAMHKIWNLEFIQETCILLFYYVIRSKHWRHGCHGVDTDEWHKKTICHNIKQLLLSQQNNIMFIIPYSLSKIQRQIIAVFNDIFYVKRCPFRDISRQCHGVDCHRVDKF